jgi:tRNA pseudouridine38-40 synthase
VLADGSLKLAIFANQKYHFYLRFFIELAYNGKPFHGWQIQPNAESVEATLENGLSLLLKEPVDVVGAGRTDTGVHACFMVAHFDSLSQEINGDLVHRLNSFLPNSVVVYRIYQVQNNAHARFDATVRTYHYKITQRKNPFLTDWAYEFKPTLDLDLMNQAAQLLLSHINFKCFSRSNTDVKTFNCNISQAEWLIQDDLLLFVVSADRFLRNMVRALVGTLLEVGVGKIEIKDFKNILDSENRSEAGASVPAHGLYLVDIQYPKNIYPDDRQ